jgi:hypothetical protein
VWLLTHKGRFGDWGLCAPGVRGRYSDYGTLEPDESPTLEILEKHFGMPFAEIVSSLQEKSFDEGNLDKGWDPKFANYSHQWYHADVWDELTTYRRPSSFDYNMGDPAFLTMLGFTPSGTGEDMRFKHLYTLGDLTVASDGERLLGSIFSPRDLAAKGVDVSILEGKDRFDFGRQLTANTFAGDEAFSFHYTYCMRNDNRFPDSVAKDFLAYAKDHTDLDEDFVDMHRLAINMFICGRNIGHYNGRFSQYGEYAQHQHFLQKWVEINQAEIDARDYDE